MMKQIIVALFLCVVTSVAGANVDPYQETRFCGKPARDAEGKIVRSGKVLTAFKKYYPCPVTGMTHGACSGWSIDHVIPLACGGCDSVANLQWLPNNLKTKAVIGKDRFERKIYETSIPCK
jgi:hypothetical protein